MIIIVIMVYNSKKSNNKNKIVIKVYNVRTHENNLPGYYFIGMHSTSVHCHVGLYRKYVKVGIHRAGIYLENIHLLNNVFREKYEFQNK